MLATVRTERFRTLSRWIARCQGVIWICCLRGEYLNSIAMVVAGTTIRSARRRRLEMMVVIIIIRRDVVQSLPLDVIRLCGLVTMIVNLVILSQDIKPPSSPISWQCVDVNYLDKIRREAS